MSLNCDKLLIDDWTSRYSHFSSSPLTAAACVWLNSNVLGWCLKIWEQRVLIPFRGGLLWSNYACPRAKMIRIERLKKTVIRWENASSVRKQRGTLQQLSLMISFQLSRELCQIWSTFWRVPVKKEILVWQTHYLFKVRRISESLFITLFASKKSLSLSHSRVKFMIIFRVIARTIKLDGCRLKNMKSLLIFILNSTLEWIINFR